MIDLTPDFTFINKAAASIGYIYSAQYLYPSYHTSPPLYLLVSHLFLMLPFGTEAWRMGLVSVLSSIGACVFIYLIIKNQLPNRRYLPLFGVLVYGLSALVLSQSIIVNTYATTCMLSAGAYYFCVKKQWKRMGLMIGIGLAVHLLMAFVFMVLFLGCREYRRNWKALLITFAFGVFYIYIPLTNRAPFMWLPDPSQVNTLQALFTDVLSTISMLIGSLAVWDLPKRIFDTIGILGISIGVVTIVPLVWYFWKTKFYKSILFWLILVPIVLFIGELDMNTFDYTMVAMPFISVAICLGLAKMRGNYAKVFQVLSLVSVLGFGLFNFQYFDIGRTLDKDLGATNLYRNEFDKLLSQDNGRTIFMPNYAWEWEAIYKYNAGIKYNNSFESKYFSDWKLLEHDDGKILFSNDWSTQGEYSLKSVINGNNSYAGMVRDIEPSKELYLKADFIIPNSLPTFEDGGHLNGLGGDLYGNLGINYDFNKQKYGVNYSNGGEEFSYYWQDGQTTLLQDVKYTTLLHVIVDKNNGLIQLEVDGNNILTLSDIDTSHIKTDKLWVGAWSEYSTKDNQSFTVCFDNYIVSHYPIAYDAGAEIYPICIDILPSETYQQALIKDGIKLVPSEVENISIKASEIAKSIVELNDNVWTTVSVDPKTFTSEVVETNHDSSLVANVDRNKINQITNNPQIQWKPYNPYHIMDTSLFITDWNYILYSNWNLRFFAGWASVGLILMWLFNWASHRKSKDDVYDDVDDEDKNED
jgi:hypothetical protein